MKLGQAELDRLRQALDAAGLGRAGAFAAAAE
jgi:hypothetical protein